MSNKEWYIVANLVEFINATRHLVFNSFGLDLNKDTDNNAMSLMELNPEDKAELDSVLSYKESQAIVLEHIKKQTNKKTKETRYLLSDTLYFQIVESLNDRMISNMLNNLVNKGVIESGYDTQSNDFVFWIKNDNKPETT